MLIYKYVMDSVAQCNAQVQKYLDVRPLNSIASRFELGLGSNEPKLHVRCIRRHSPPSSSRASFTAREDGKGGEISVDADALGDVDGNGNESALQEVLAHELTHAHDVRSRPGLRCASTCICLSPTTPPFIRPCCWDGTLESAANSRARRSVQQKRGSAAPSSTTPSVGAVSERPQREVRLSSFLSRPTLCRLMPRSAQRLSGRSAISASPESYTSATGLGRCLDHGGMVPRRCPTRIPLSLWHFNASWQQKRLPRRHCTLPPRGDPTS